MILILSYLNYISNKFEFFYSDIEINTIGGDTMKGSPRSEPENWEYDAWKKEDMPKQLIGQFDPLVVVPANRMKVGIVKGYRHYK